MKKPASLLFFTAVVCMFFTPVFSQNVTGIWKGYFTTNDGQQYKLEFQIEGSNKAPIKGVSYSYGQSVFFYGKATMSGSYRRDLGYVIEELKTVEVKSGGGGTCLMRYRMTYAKSGNEEFLEGVYVGKTEDRANPANNGTWGDCGGGRVYLRKVTTTEFPLEPFLQKKIVQKPPARTPAPQRPTTAQKKPVTTKPPATSTTKTPTSKNQPNTAQNTPAARPKVDTISRQTTAVAIENKTPEKRINTPIATRERKNELTKTLLVGSPEIEIRLYDNGEIDNDTVSIYLDGKLILANKRLSDKPISYKIQMDESNPEHTIVMVAENLGSIPPNTSLMIVQDGDKRYQVSITSTEQKNAMVRFRYQKP